MICHNGYPRPTTTGHKVFTGVGEVLRAAETKLCFASGRRRMKLPNRTPFLFSNTRIGTDLEARIIGIRTIADLEWNHEDNT